MKKPVYPENSSKHIECSIIAFNGICPIKEFKTDDNFLVAWRAHQIQKKKFIAVKAYDLEFAKNEESFYRITKKLRHNSDYNKAGELKAYAFFRRNYGIDREEIEKKLGLGNESK